MVEAMLKREECLRLSAETQRQFREARQEANGVFRIVEALQRRVVHEFGLPEDVGLEALRRAEQWIGSARAQKLSLYRRHNRLADGPLTIGAEAPLGTVPPLLCLSRGETMAKTSSFSMSLSAMSKPGRPLVLVAGSHS